MKKFLAILSLVLCMCILGGCMGTPVIYHGNCDCPTQGGNTPTQGGDTPTQGTEATANESVLKTGLALVTGISGSSSATAEKNGEGKYDVTMVAVLVDDQGVIRDCIIDGISTSVKFDAAGQIVTDLTAAPQTNNELGDKYGMVAYGNAKFEWYQQAQALADFAVGKTVQQLRSGAVSESGYAPQGSDLASSATIYLGGYVSAIEAAVANATHLGAKSGDSLRLAAQTGISSSKSAGEKKGATQLDVTVTALTMKDGVITSCTIDSVQAKVEFDATGTVTSNLEGTVKTKNQLGKDYGMMAYGNAKFEWNEQAASFAGYVTGKTPAQVAGIAVNESTKPTDADLASSVTIAIGGFQALIAKACQ